MDFFYAGGPVMYVLFLISVVALSLILYSLRGLRSMTANPEEWCHRALSSLEVSVDSSNTDRLGEALQEISFSLQSSIQWLSRLASMATLLGLLGTVLGISQAFFDMQQKGAAGPEVFAAGIYQALHTTIAGLLLALPFLLAHHLLRDSIARHHLTLLGRLRRMLEQKS